MLNSDAGLTFSERAWVYINAINAIYKLEGRKELSVIVKEKIYKGVEFFYTQRKEGETKDDIILKCSFITVWYAKRTKRTLDSSIRVFRKKVGKKLPKLFKQQMLLCIKEVGKSLRR